MCAVRQLNSPLHVHFSRFEFCLLVPGGMA